MRVDVADVYKAGVRAAHIKREPDGVTSFSYLPDYLDRDGPPVASTLPLSDKPRITPAGSVPPFFAGLLPEGRRLSGLQRAVKTSADDELSLLVAVGADTVGDVQIVGEDLDAAEPPSTVSISKGFDEIRFSDLLADSGIVDPIGIAGVQDKVSARMISLPVKRAHERFILKLSPSEFPGVVEDEALFLALAKRIGLNAASATVVHDAENRSGLLVKRFDRSPIGRLAAEDACQALDRWPADKYNVSMEQAATALVRLCGAPTIAAREVFRQIVFAWITGNGDLHAKNLSVLANGSGEYRISPAYDLPSTLPYDDTTFALTIDDDAHDFTRDHFHALAQAIGLPLKAEQSVVDAMLIATANLDVQLETSGLPFDSTVIEKTVTALRARRARLIG